MPIKSLDISDQFKPEAIQKLKKGMLLRFNYEGSINELIITKVNKKSGKVYARMAKTYTVDEFSKLAKK